MGEELDKQGHEPSGVEGEIDKKKANDEPEVEAHMKIGKLEPAEIKKG